MDTMLRRLIVMRHAKSSWKSEALDDHARPLNKRGRREAPLVGGRLQEMGWTPEVVLCSDALRARETLAAILDEFSPRPQVAYLPALYHGGIHELRKAVAGLSPEMKIVLALGHNPGWQDAVDWLCGEEVELKTASAALLESSGDTWRDALHGEGAWQLIDILRPKALSPAE
jgi:phosphohistidine phosphatase SixA